MMRTLKISAALALTIATLWIGGAKAQQPTPSMVIVQPAAPAATAKPAPASGVSDETLLSAISALEKVKATNDETLKKQEAMMQQLDELQKATEQLKIFSKRV